MNKFNTTRGGFVVALIGLAGILPVSAELPSMNEKAWLGYFVGVKNNKFQFGVTSQGKATLMVIGKKGEPMTGKLAIPVEFRIDETLPDGKIVAHKLLPETLESAQPATDKPKGVVIRGKVKGDASFEVTVDEARGGISLGGHLIEPGTLTKNPLRFCIEVRFPNVYADAKKDGDKKVVKAFEDKTKGDRVQVAWADKKRKKLDTAESIDATSKDINGEGIVATEVEFASYDDRKFEFTATENSLMTLSNKQPGALRDGFSLTWAADPAKDPQARCRLNLEMK